MKVKGLIGKLNMHDNYAIAASNVISITAIARNIITSFNAIFQVGVELKEVIQQEIKQMER